MCRVFPVSCFPPGSFGRTTSFSVSVYVRATTVNTEAMIASDRDTTWYRAGWFLSFASDGRIHGAVSSSMYNGAWIYEEIQTSHLYSGQAVNDGKWHQVCGACVRVWGDVWECARALRLPLPLLCGPSECATQPLLGRLT